MKVVKVTYTVKPGYAAKNTENIKTVMNDLLALNHAGIFYTACVGEDGRTFIHIAFFKSAGDQQVLLNLPSFTSFQQQLAASGPETAPKQELLTFIGSSVNLF